MQYREFVINIYYEAQEALNHILLEEAIEGCIFAQKGNILTCTFFLPLSSSWQEKWSRIKESINQLPNYNLRIQPFSFEDRNQDLNWLDAYLNSQRAPKEIIENIWIVPEDFNDEPQPANLYIKLKTGMAFGTGDHPSTRLALGFLKDTFTSMDKVLDLGTGTGILALAAAFLGAQEVLAIDHDPEAVSLATANVSLNGLGDIITVLQGDATTTLSGKFDGIIINILFDVILRLLPNLASLLAPAGKVVLSGILTRQISALELEIQKTPFQVKDIRIEDEWASLLIAR